MKHFYKFAAVTAMVACLGSYPTMLFAQDENQELDMTESIINPGFDDDQGMVDGSPYGWTSAFEGNPQLKLSTGAKGDPVIIEGGQKHLQIYSWGGPIVGTVSQQLTDLPNGNYKIGVKIVVAEGFEGSAYLFGNTSRTAITKDVNGTYEADVLVSDGTLDLGISLDLTSGICLEIEDFTLTYLAGSADEVQLQVYNNMLKKKDEVESLIASPELDGYIGLFANAEDFVMNGIYEVDSNDIDAMNAAIESMNGMIADIKAGLKLIGDIDAVMSVAEQLSDLNYPGLDTFVQTITSIAEYVDKKETNTLADYQEALDQLNEAIKTYRFSQEATKDNPADYTFLVSSPSFCGDAAEESDATKNMGEWKKTSSFAGGDQRLNFTHGRTCWNAWWSTSATDQSTLQVMQELSDLPDGIYGITCVAITQPNMLTDQHAFVQSSADKAISPYMTITGWDDSTLGDNGWETLTTGTVIVNNGKLTIGFESSKKNAAGLNGSEGWWCATGFKLNYYGKAAASEVETLFNEKLASAEAMVDTMHFAADKALLAAVITEAKASEMQAGIETLQAGIIAASASEKHYSEIMQDGRIYPVVTNALAETNGYGAARKLVEFAYAQTNAYLKSDTATYQKVDSILTNLKAYSNNLAPVYKDASDTLALMTSQVAKEMVTEGIKVIDENVMVGQMLVPADINEYVARLKNTVYLAVAQNLYDTDKDMTDYSVMIMNATPDNTDGWTINRGTGNADYSKSGSHYLGGSYGYFHSWNPTIGALNYYGEQTVKGIPNGKYIVKAATRATGKEGAFIFARNTADEADNVYARIEMGKHYNYETEEYEDANSVYGDIWEEANAAVEAGTGTEEQEIIAGVNGGKGRGWGYTQIEIVVNNHEVTIGMTTDAARTGEAFTGTQFSVTEWTLTLVEKVEDPEWFGPATSIDAVATDGAKVVKGTYSLAGMRIADEKAAGNGIIIRDGKKYLAK